MVNQEVINGTFKQPTSSPLAVFGATTEILDTSSLTRSRTPRLNVLRKGDPVIVL